MKKILFIGLICISMVLNTDAQDVKVDNFRLGFQATPFISWMTSNDNKINSNGSNLGFTMSFVAEYYFSEQYSFVTGLNYSFNQGGKLQHELGGNLLPRSEFSDDLEAAIGSDRQFLDGTNIRYKIDYLQIPIGLKMRTREFGYLRYFAQLPEFAIGIPVNSRANITNDAQSLEHNKESVSKDVTFINIYWGLGGGVEYSVSSSASITAGIHYQQAFIDMTSDRGTKNNGKKEDSNSKTGMIQFRIGVLF